MTQRKRILVANRIRTPDGTILQSMHRHDYRCHIDDVTRAEYCVDGGIYCPMRSFMQLDYEEANVYLDSPYEEVREAFHWGSRGVGGREPLRHIPLNRLEDEHIEAILATQTQIPKWMRVLFKYELKYRDKIQNWPY